MSLDLIKQVNALLGDEIAYIPYDLRDTLILYGLPPVPVKGLEYVWADYSQPQTGLIMSLNGNGAYVPNNNKSGIIEFATMTGTVTGGGVQILDMLPIPVPIVITDTASGGTSTVVSLSSKLVKTPEYRRAAVPGVDIFTFVCKDLYISTGVRLAE